MNVINIPLIPNLIKSSPVKIFKAKELYLKKMHNGKSYYYLKNPQNNEYLLLNTEEETSTFNHAYLKNSNNFETLELIYDFSLNKTYFYNISIIENKSSMGHYNFINIGNENQKFLLPIAFQNIFNNFFEIVKMNNIFEVNIYFKVDNSQKTASIVLQDGNTNTHTIEDAACNKIQSLYEDVSYEQLVPGQNYLAKTKNSLTGNDYYQINATFLKKTTENYFILKYENDEIFLVPNTENKEGYLFEISSGLKIIIDNDFLFSKFLTNLCQEIMLPLEAYAHNNIEFLKMDKTPFFNANKLCEYINNNEKKYIENYRFSLMPLEQLEQLFNKFYFIHEVKNRQIIYKIQANKCSYFFKYQKKYYYPQLQFATPVGEAIFDNGKIVKIKLFADDLNLKELEWNPFPSLHDLFSTINQATLHGLSFIDEDSKELDSFIQNGKQILQNKAKKVISLLKDDLSRLHNKALLSLY